MSTAILTPAAYLAREAALLTAFRELLRVKASHELVVVVVYPSATGKYWTRQVSPGGLVDADGQPVITTTRVAVMGVRLGTPPGRPRSGILSVGHDPHTLSDRDPA